MVKHAGETSDFDNLWAEEVPIRWFEDLLFDTHGHNDVFMRLFIDGFY